MRESNPLIRALTPNHARAAVQPCPIASAPSVSNLLQHLLLVSLAVFGAGAVASAQEVPTPDPIPTLAFADLFALAPLTDEPPAALNLRLQDPSLQQAPPHHTGLSALLRATAADFNSFPRRKSTYVLLAIGGAAAGLAHPLDDDINEHLQDSAGLRHTLAPGRYIGSTWVQAGLAIGTYAYGRFGKPGGTRTNKFSHIGVDLLRAQNVSSVITSGIKVAVKRNRPTGECCSFPSGHATVTFATAAVLERHFGYRGAWPTFVVAGYVAASRLSDNRHFASDVLFGSAIGMASGWTVVGRHGRNSYVVVPVPTRGGVAVSVSWHPREHGAHGE